MDLKKAVDSVFDTYDVDRSGTLESNQIAELINDALEHMGQKRKVNHQEVYEFIRAIDENQDGKVAK